MVHGIGVNPERLVLLARSFVEPAHLSEVTGQVVRDQPIVAEHLARGVQLVIRLLGAV